MPVEKATPPQDTSAPVLVLTRLENDRVAIGRILEAAQIPFLRCSDVAMLCEKLSYSLAAVVTLKAVTPEQWAPLQATLAAQPPWSDIPLIVLTGRVVSPRLHERLQALGNVTLLERPLHPSSFLSLIRSAVRARGRQWEVRDLLSHNQALNRDLRRAMTETHHRIKNNLQLIAALIDYQLMEQREMVAAEELRRIGTHIGTLATIHDILTYETKADRRANSVSVKDVLERLLPLMQQTAGGRHIQFHVDDMVLPTRQGASLAIIINELISNALKYAARDIKVEFRVGPDRACLTVQDDGPGFPEGFTSVGMGRTGLELVTTLTRHDLNGELRFENDPENGSIVRMSFPLL